MCSGSGPREREYTLFIIKENYLFTNLIINQNKSFMKKITSFLLMVLASVVAVAQGITPITSLDQLDNEKVYTLKSGRCALLYSSKLPNQLATTNGKVLGGEVVYNPTDVNQHFRIELQGDSYYLFSVGAGKYVKQDGSYVDDYASASVLTIQDQSGAFPETPWYLQIGSHGMNSQIPGQTDTGIILNTWTTPDAGNCFEIAEINLDDLNPYQMPWEALESKYNSFASKQDGQFIQNLKDEVNVGASYGNYKPEIVEFFLAKTDSVETWIAGFATDGGLTYIETQFETPEAITAFGSRLQQAHDSLVNNTVPRAMKEIAAGYYTINSNLMYVRRDTTVTYYTQEEADAYNDEQGCVEGEENFKKEGDVKETNVKLVPTQKAIYAHKGKANWGDIKENADFLFWIEPTQNDSVPSYKIINKIDDKTFKPIKTSTHVEFETCDTAEFVIDFYEQTKLQDGTERTAVAIRRIPGTTEKGYNYLHTAGHNFNNTDGVSYTVAGNVVGWSASGATYWFLNPIDEATAQAWMEASVPVKQVRPMVDLGDSIAAAFPAQLEIAKDIETIVYEDSVVTDPAQFSSPYTETREGDITKLLDGDPSTYWHSDWSSAVGAHVHYLQIEAAAPVEGMQAVKMSRRAGAQNDHPVKLVVKGYETNDEGLTYEDGDSLATLNFPFQTAGETVVSEDLFDAKGYTVFRFYWEDSNGGTDRGFWHCSEFNIFKAYRGPHYEKSQYTERKDLADALAAAVETWEAGEYNRDNGELLNDEAFKAAYNAITEKGAAWGAVYVNPAALREAIAAVPTNIEEMYPIGTNPGEWSNRDNVTVTAAAAAAQAYDESGLYTPAESEAMIKAMADAQEVALDAANKVKTGVWYRIGFHSEAKYDAMGWSKAGPQAVTSKGKNSGKDIEVYHSLFGKYLASGISTSKYSHSNVNEAGVEVIDTVRQYNPELSTEAYYEGMRLMYFNNEDLAEANGADLFRFIEATDSSYMIQHKTSGLFVKAGWPVELSPIPSYWQVNAIGAGANLVFGRTVTGEKDSNGYMHGQRSDGALVTWDASTLGSNSMMLIEEVEGAVVEDEIPADYIKWMWRGQVYACTLPVDVTITADENLMMDGATAYGVDLGIKDVNEDGVVDTVITLRPVVAEAMPIKHGTPFIMIADYTEEQTEFESYEDATERIKEEIAAENGKDFVAGSDDANALNDALEGMYAWVVMNHGMEVDTTLHALGESLVGTMKQVTVKPGKGFVASDDSFKLVTSNTNVAAYSAYVAADFDEDAVVNGLIINVGENITETGIAEVLNKVAQSGNIYTVGGQLVGKGNINTVNNLPAGVYIVNGVKVTKR